MESICILDIIPHEIYGYILTPFSLRNNIFRCKCVWNMSNTRSFTMLAHDEYYSLFFIAFVPRWSRKRYSCPQMLNECHNQCTQAQSVKQSPNQNMSEFRGRIDILYYIYTYTCTKCFVRCILSIYFSMGAAPEVAKMLCLARYAGG